MKIDTYMYKMLKYSFEGDRVEKKSLKSPCELRIYISKSS